jgi:hypothetical protein
MLGGSPLQAIHIIRNANVLKETRKQHASALVKSNLYNRKKQNVSSKLLTSRYAWLKSATPTPNIFARDHWRVRDISDFKLSGEDRCCAKKLPKSSRGTESTLTE